MIAKYRGITEKKQFVYGYVFEDSGEFYIKNKRGCFEVDKDSISQFTGLTDYVGAEVYENDWLSATVNMENGEVKKIAGIVYWNYGAWEVEGFRFKELNNLKVEVECYNK